AVKDQKLRGKEREAAISQNVTPLESDELTARCEWLVALETVVPAPFLSLGKSIAVSEAEFRTFSRRMADRLIQGGPKARSDASFVTAFGCESCVDRNGRVVPTGFQLITGSG